MSDIDVLSVAEAIIMQRAADARDAARYRHLRACNSGSLVIIKIIGTGDDDQVVLTEADADAEVDAEIATLARNSGKEG